MTIHALNVCVLPYISHLTSYQSFKPFHPSTNSFISSFNSKNFTWKTFSRRMKDPRTIWKDMEPGEAWMAQSVKHLLSAQVMTPGFWDGAPHWVP